MEELLEEDRHEAEFYMQVLLLAEIVKRILERKADLEVSSKPNIQLKPITEFCKKMRVSGITKFQEKTYISTINLFHNNEDLKANKPVGVLIIYLGENNIVKVMQSLNYPVIDEDDTESLESGVGTLCNLIAGNFNRSLDQIGFKELVMSHFSTYQNDVVNGVDYQLDQKYLYEVSFDVKGRKSIVVDLSLGPIKKVFDD